jgi:hypothetical protein
LSQPQSISLSSTATEMLLAIDAGDQVVVGRRARSIRGGAVTDLADSLRIWRRSSSRPDLVVISYDPGELVSGYQVGVPRSTAG